ncbi:L-histidine N(alpha)-methyltransferase [Roseivirga misakiensis]|uniref:Dimethylhistidine N-methyltransferase n=1 Tax=Roseivirga misakiensis TaxID=1563681 RepID=A0A1E5SK15_9BACT|nr:L-histidine N(alpha)-methyltransferase [Roseivirga misakiensis]OEJ99458.1 dimethylhistidine N-methyltransferase [Roseivirga misakiensis]
MNDSTEALSAFAEDIRTGLNQFPKTLPSRYFYDQIGDELFQRIMDLDEYYLTRAEFEVFVRQKAEILKAFLGDNDNFRLVELGAGDGTKTKVLLSHFVEQKVDFTYSPIDISGHVLAQLKDDLSAEIPSLKVEPIVGEYFSALKELSGNDSTKEVVLFLGSNIGNFDEASGVEFLKHIGANLAAGDMLLIGFDLMKDPRKILSAYNDREGVTKAFNLNLLTRINSELGANFKIDQFDHFPTYDPLTGETKSHIVSKIKQEVFIEALGESIDFEAWEAIHTEVSQKYSYKMIESFAEEAGFRIVKNFTDSNDYFVDSLWEKV